MKGFTSSIILAALLLAPTISNPYVPLNDSHASPEAKYFSSRVLGTFEEPYCDVSFCVEGFICCWTCCSPDGQCATACY